MKYGAGLSSLWSRLIKRLCPVRNWISFQSIGSRQKGISLVELLIALAMSAILVSIAVPSMKFFIVKTRIATTTDEVYGSLMLARSEAIKRQRTVSLCSTVDNFTCDETNSGWHHGWLVFTDESGDGLLNGRDQMIHKVSDLSHLVSITWNRGGSLRFNSRGQTTQAGTFQVCGREDDELDAKAIVISMIGRLRTEERGACS